MSRIGKLPVAIPAKVKVAVADNTVSVEGPKGKLSRRFDPAIVAVEADEKEVRVSPVAKSRFARAMYGTARSLINGMVEGAANGFEKNLTINGVGFKAEVKGKVLHLALGYSHPIEQPIADGLTVTVADQTKIKVQGADKQMVGEFAARVQRYYPVEPYKGKGVVIDGQYIIRKEGKKAG